MWLGIQILILQDQNPIENQLETTSLYLQDLQSVSCLSFNQL